MDRYMIVIPAKNRAFNMKCDDGDSMKLETLQKLVGGPIEPVPALLSAEWAREKDVDGILLLVNEEGLMKERPLTNQRASEMTAAELVGPAVVAAKRGDEPKVFNAMLRGRKRMTSDDVVPICKALGVTPNELFGIPQPADPKKSA